ncbi:MAG: GNAT family N-acetyltransferase [Caulobacterales bacterium]
MRIQLITIADPLYPAAVSLREDVLRKPLGLRFAPEELALDAAREHFIAVADDHVIGSVSLYRETPGIVRVKQMAVSPHAQGRGIGAALLDAAEIRARGLGATQVRLHARRTAERFYTQQGYAVEGAEFLEQGIPHIVMTKAIA